MGFQMHTRATELIETGHFSDDSVDPITGLPVEMSDEKMMDQYRGQVMWPQVWHPQEEWGGHGEVYTIHSIEEAAQLAHKYNHTLSDMFGMPSAADVGRANEYFAFMLMAIGWFLILASVGGWARVKRFEHKLRQAQKESEEAQRAARGSIDELHPNEGEDPTPTRQQPGPTELAYYTSAFTQALNGARELQRGFFGMRGRREVSRGDTVFSADNDNDESELLAAQGYDVDHAVVDPDARRNRSLW
jgi:hypothetical protein